MTNSTLSLLITGTISIVCIVGSIVLAALGIPIPDWLKIADGAVIANAFNTHFLAAVATAHQTATETLLGLIPTGGNAGVRVDVGK